MSKSARERAREWWRDRQAAFAASPDPITPEEELLRDLLAEADAYRADCLALRAQDRADADEFIRLDGYDGPSRGKLSGPDMAERADAADQENEPHAR